MAAKVITSDVTFRGAMTRANALRERVAGAHPEAYTDRFISDNAFVPSRGRLGRYQPSPLTISDRRYHPRLRDYQAEFVEAAWARYLLGQDRMLCVMPPGAGKTPTAAELMMALAVQWHDQASAWETLATAPAPQSGLGRWWPRNLRLAAARGRDLTPPPGILAVAHRDYLIEVLCQRLRRTFGNEAVGVLRGSAQHLRRPIIVASAQTLPDQFAAIDPMRFGLVVLDEAHHYVPGNRWADFLIRLGFLSPTGELQGVWPRCLVGLTATPERLTGQPVCAVFGPEGLVAPVDATSLWARTEPVIHKPAFIRLQMSDDINQASGESLGAIVDELLSARWPTADEVPHSIIFVNRIAQIDGVVAALHRRGIAAAGLSRQTIDTERGTTLTAFRERKIRILVNVSIVGEGLHIPSVEVVMLLFRSDSRSRVLQDIGRVMSIDPLHPDQSVLVVDGGDNIKRHRLHLTMAASYAARPSRARYETVTTGTGRSRPAPAHTAALQGIDALSLVGRAPRTSRVEDTMHRLGITAEQIHQLAYRSHWLSDQLFAYFNGARVPDTFAEMNHIAEALGDSTGQLLDAWAWEMVAQQDLAAPLPADLGPARRIWHRYCRWVCWRRYGGEPRAMSDVSVPGIERILAGTSLLGNDTGTWVHHANRLAPHLIVPGRAHWFERALQRALAAAGAPPWMATLHDASIDELMRVGLLWFAERLSATSSFSGSIDTQGLPGGETFARHFGSWTYALRAIGLTPDDIEFSRERRQTIAQVEAAPTLVTAMRIATAAEEDAELLGDVWAWHQVALWEQREPIDADLTVARRAWTRFLRFLHFRTNRTALHGSPTVLARVFSGASLLGSDRGLWAARLHRLLDPTQIAPYTEQCTLLLNAALRDADYPPWAPALRDESEEHLLLRGLAWLAERLGHVPTGTEVDHTPALAGKATYIKYFGSWSAVRKALEVYRHGPPQTPCSTEPADTSHEPTTGVAPPEPVVPAAAAGDGASLPLPTSGSQSFPVTPPSPPPAERHPPTGAHQIDSVAVIAVPPRETAPPLSRAVAPRRNSLRQLRHSIRNLGRRLLNILRSFFRSRRS
ncbi:MAG: DEAD/DEAH box helicase family protein [Deltaproteobacteria bacterium]|nr:DEAD/DEAH box helicase family protein [Deltaproteobacteria bacterium]